MRKAKDGLDYFSLDTNFYYNSKVRALKSRYGNDGISLLLYIYCECYRDKGYYMNLSEDDRYVAADFLGIDFHKFEEMLEFLESRLNPTIMECKSLVAGTYHYTDGD